ncbi:MAG TPA: DNA repair protein RadC [Kofleriaceae bacterium]|nr:DNA repair protein RadC [Kofleriaceae bacterium]
MIAACSIPDRRASRVSRAGVPGTFYSPERPRERLLAHGADHVSTDELLAVILGTGTRGRSAVTLARELSEEVGGLVALARAAPHELTGIAGIGAARAVRIAAAFALGRRAIEVEACREPRINGPSDVHARLRARLSGLKQEVFWVLALDARNAIIAELEIARGCLTSVDVHPREVFRPLIRHAAAAGVVAHNHPSGGLKASADDLALTERLRAVGELCGIPIVDHVIIGRDGFVSLAEYLV